MASGPSWTVDPTLAAVAGRTDPEGQGGRQDRVSVVVATAVNGEGKREIIGMDVGTSEDGAFWLAFLRSLSARGLGAGGLGRHQGLRGAIAAVFGGSWHGRSGGAWPPWRTIYQQPSRDSQLGDRFRWPLYC